LRFKKSPYRVEMYGLWARGWGNMYFIKKLFKHFPSFRYLIYYLYYILILLLCQCVSLFIKLRLDSIKIDYGTE